MDLIIYEKQEHRGYTCKVYYDPDPTSPNDWDTLGTIYSCHRDYNPQRHKMDEIIYWDEEGKWHVDENYIFVLIYFYEHSGIAIWSSRDTQRCGWDSGLFGLMAVHKDKAAKEFGDMTNAENYENAMKCLEAEVEEWNLYCKGEVYGFEVLDEDDCVIDSCWGYYGDEGAEEAMSEGIAIIDNIVDKAEKEEAEHQAHVQLCERICEPFWID